LGDAVRLRAYLFVNHAGKALKRTWSIVMQMPRTKMTSFNVTAKYGQDTMSRIHPSSIRNTASILDRKKSLLAGDCFVLKNVVPDEEGSPISRVPFEISRKDRVFDSSRRTVQCLIENDMLPQNPRYNNFLPKSVFLAPGEVIDDALIYDKDPAARLTHHEGYISPRTLARRETKRSPQNPYKGNTSM
jgi:hypothetical protein